MAATLNFKRRLPVDHNLTDNLFVANIGLLLEFLQMRRRPTAIDGLWWSVASEFSSAFESTAGSTGDDRLK
jgi:hypothetical protein